MNILFVCLGNICRSPMAEFVFKDMLEKEHMSGINVSSAATSSWEIGNSVHSGTVLKLSEAGISCRGKRAVQLTAEDYEKYDLLIGMEKENIKDMKRITGGDAQNKMHLLLDFSERKGSSIADPWYTGDFDTTYKDVTEGCKGLIEYLKNNNPKAE